MRNRRQVAPVALACVSLLSVTCGQPKPPTVAILRNDGLVHIMGAIQLTVGTLGEGSRADYWRPGNVLICRVGHTFKADSCKGGRAYVIRGNGHLREIDAVDIAKSDEDLAALYGVHVAQNEGFLQPAP